MKVVCVAAMCVAVLTSLAVSGRAESPFERDLKQLQDQRDKALASVITPLDRQYQQLWEQLQRVKAERDKASVAAKEPVLRSYQAALEQLLRRATTANDLDAAMKIKQEMVAKVLTVTYVKGDSAKPFPKKHKEGNFPEMLTDDPEDVMRGRPIYFDKKTGMQMIYQVSSPKPLSKLSYTGAAFANFFIEIHNTENEKIASVGPIGGGNILKTVDLTFPDTMNFKIVIKENSGNWTLIKDLKLE